MSLILSLALVLAGFCQHQILNVNAEAITIEKSESGLYNENQVLDVIIIGAGWAGVGAADYISRHSPNTTFLVLEATGRTGGRMEAAVIGGALDSDATQDSCLAQGINVELGPMWMPGSDIDEDYGENILSRLAYKNDLVSVVPGEGGMEFLDAFGESVDPDGTLMDELKSALGCVGNSLEDEPPSGANLRSCGWKATNLTQKALESGFLECSGYSDSYHPSWEEMTTFMWGKQRLVTDQQSTRGFARLLDALVGESSLPSHFQFHAHVERIEYGNEFVSVSTKSRTFQAHQVISTIPLGVLQRQHKELFSPPLSNEMQTALSPRKDGINMVNVTKVYLQFPHVWWNDDVQTWILANDVITSWRNMNHKSIIPGSNTLLAIATGSSSSRLETLNEEYVKKLTMKLLQNHFPNTTIPTPSNFLVTRHGTNENRFGAFSASNSCQSIRHFYTAFAQPLRNKDGVARVRFAGDAHCPGYIGYVHGALFSGIETKYLYEAGIGPDPEKDDLLSICSDSFDYACP